MAAGLGIAKAISEKQNPIRFEGEVTDNADDDDDDKNISENDKMVKKSSLKHSNLLSAEEMK